MRKLSGGREGGGRERTKTGNKGYGEREAEGKSTNVEGEGVLE